MYFPHSAPAGKIEQREKSGGYRSVKTPGYTKWNDKDLTSGRRKDSFIRAGTNCKEMNSMQKKKSYKHKLPVPLKSMDLQGRFMSLYAREMCNRIKRYFLRYILSPGRFSCLDGGRLIPEQRAAKKWLVFFRQEQTRKDPLQLFQNKGLCQCLGFLSWTLHFEVLHLI